jgi:dolichol kinase
MRWAGNAVWNLLEIIFAVVAPGAIGYIKKAAGAFRTILKNPIGFVGNLVRAGKLGFQQFAANIGKHLKSALIQWLTGSLGGAGVYIPQSFDIREIIKFVLSVLGLTWQNIRQKLVKVLGETAVKALETGFDIVVTLVTQGPAAAWEKIKEALTNLKEMVIEGIMSFVIEKVVQSAVIKLVSMLNPAGAVIQAIIAIYNTIMFFIERLRTIIQVAMAFIDSIAAIANGVIGAAANRVEATLAGLLTLAISFLARLVGLGKVSDAVIKIINKIRAPIDKALDRVVDWIVKTAKKFLAKLTGKDKDKDPEKEKKLQAGLKALQEVTAKYASEEVDQQQLGTETAGVKSRNPVFISLAVEAREKKFIYRYRTNPEGTAEGPVQGDNWRVGTHTVDKPTTAKKNAKGESHHVPAKVLLSWIGDVFKVAGEAFDRPALKSKGAQIKGNPEGTGLSAIWLSKKAHKAVHSRPGKPGDLAALTASIKGEMATIKAERQKDEEFQTRMITTQEGLPTAKPGRATLGRELLGVDVGAFKTLRTKAGKRFRDAVKAKWSQMRSIIQSAYNYMLAAGVTFVKQGKLSPPTGWEGELKSKADSTWKPKITIPPDDES